MLRGFSWVETLARLRIELHQADITKVGAVCEPQLTDSRIEEDTGINRITVLDSIG